MSARFERKINAYLKKQLIETLRLNLVQYGLVDIEIDVNDTLMANINGRWIMLFRLADKDVMGVALNFNKWLDYAKKEIEALLS